MCLGAAALGWFVWYGPGGDAPGVVATVDGRAITFRELREAVDLAGQDAGGEAGRVESLRRRHLRTLQEMIAQELAAQELRRHGLVVDEAELAAAEERIRAQYPQGGLEQLLADEGLDLEAWRRRQRGRLAVRLLVERVITPRLAVDPAEVEAYHRDHAAEFRLPPRISLLVLSGPEADMAQAAAETARGQDPREVLARRPAIAVRPVDMAEERLPPAWRQATLGLGPGRMSEAIQDQGTVVRLLLLGRSPAAAQDLETARPAIVARLLEVKAAAAYEAWLAQALSGASVRVATRLLQAVPDQPADGVPETSSRDDEAPPPEDVLALDEEASAAPAR